MARTIKTKAEDDKYYTLPRLYVQDPLGSGKDVALSTAHVHYLRNVLRRTEGDDVRLFNGRDGEWLCALSSLSKKSGIATCTENLREQMTISRRVHIYVSPLKKAPFDVLIQKAVELGATDIHPVLYPRSTTRKVNPERIRAHVTEAAEQCERMDMPVLHDLQSMDAMVKSIAQPQIFAAIERHDVQPLTQNIIPPDQDVAFVIGPEGGFSDEDIAALNQIKSLKAVSLGPYLLRAETATLMCLSLAIK